jgi:2-methylcitrate dehydratase PrpD
VIYTFTESARLSNKYPRNTEEAQYNLIATQLIRGEVGKNQVLHELDHKERLAMFDKIGIQSDLQLDDHFPKKPQVL